MRKPLAQWRIETTVLEGGKSVSHSVQLAVKGLMDPLMVGIDSCALTEESVRLKTANLGVIS